MLRFFCLVRHRLVMLYLNFSAVAASFGLKVSWVKTKVRDLGSGTPTKTVTISVQGVK